MSSDLDKSKIEIVRDALKDVIDTIRAQDRKASYMIAIAFFLITAFTMATIKINTLDEIRYLDHLVLFFPLLFFIVGVSFLFYSYNPVSNPTEVLIKDDEEFGRDKFFIFYMEDRDKSGEELATKFIEDTKEIKDILRVLYIEILKLSKIRERKVSYIKKANLFLFVGLCVAFLQILTFYNFSFWLLGLSVISVVTYKLCKKS
ncbi:MAG TPA: hypothetical protein K8U92_05450 [Aliarcobacter thereius]|nr:hypothetical protein [Aliarcobacter thereius]HJE03307.1 hypothetical protein [Aliarcobacter thereius]